MRKIEYIERHHNQCVEVLSAVFGDKDIIGVEVGTNAGDLTKTLLRDLPNLKRLVTIDPWKHFEGAQYEAGNQQSYHDEQKKAALHKVKEFGSRVKIMEMTSDEAFAFLRSQNVCVDFVWIDGHHTKEQVEKDIMNAIALLVHCCRKKNHKMQLIGGHDYGLVPDVKEVVDKIFENHAINTGGDYTWWVTYE